MVFVLKPALSTAGCFGKFSQSKTEIEPFSTSIHKKVQVRLNISKVEEESY